MEVCDVILASPLSENKLSLFRVAVRRELEKGEAGFRRRI
jgi:hypothetical protein